MNTPTLSKCDRTPTKATCDRTPTPRTDEAWAAWQYAGSGISVHVGRELERELTAVTEQRDRLAEAIRLTLMENLHLADGDKCTLKRLKDAIGFEQPLNQTEL